MTSTRALETADDEEESGEFEEFEAGLKIAEHLCMEAKQYWSARVCRIINKLAIEYLEEIEVLKFALRMSDALRARPVCECCKGIVLKDRNPVQGGTLNVGTQSETRRENPDR